MPAGRPPLFKTNDELQEVINKYFEDGIAKKTILIGKPPNQQAIIIEVPTITGLANYLGFESRQSFYDYENKGEFSYTIKKARLSIEQNYEELLQTGNPTGAIFALKNFGWRDRIEQETNISGGITITWEEPKLHTGHGESPNGELQGL